MTRALSLARRSVSAVWRGITYLRLALSNLLFLLALVLLYALYSSTSPPPLPDRTALLLDPVGTVVDEKTRIEPLALLSEPSPANAETLLQDMIEAVQAAATDERITALVIDTQNLVRLGLSRAQELAPAFAVFRETGKPIIAVGDFFTQDQYLLAAEADEVVLHPYGGVAVQGFASYQNYFKEALEKLAVDVHVFKAGEFKSIAEPLTRNDMSEGEKGLTRAWLDDLWGQYAARVETLRRLDSGALEDQINAYSSRLADAAGDTAQLALAEGLVDHLMSRREAEDYLASRAGAVNTSGEARMVSFQRYLARRVPTRGDAPRIAVVTAQGNILPGEQEPGSIGAESLSEQLLEVAESPDVAAIVLRMNSGGGSAFASEVIRATVADIREAGTPVVMSMGPVAASGAYLIATAVDEIWATPATLTGSIGVFAALPTVDRLLTRLGVYTDGVATSDVAGALRLDRPLDPTISDVLQQSVDQLYARFLALVSEGRGMSIDAVDAVAQGRVWSATAAREIGLVDELGSVEDAAAAAAALAGVSDYQVDFVGRRLSPRQQLLQQLAERVALTGVGEVFGRGPSLPPTVSQALLPVERALDAVSGFTDPRHLYMQCLGCGL